MNIDEIIQWKKEHTVPICEYDFEVTVSDEDNVIERLTIDNGGITRVELDTASLDIASTGGDIIVNEEALTDELLEKNEVNFDHLKKTMSEYMSDNIIIDVSSRGYPAITSTRDFIDDVISVYKDTL